jgi:sporulation protein YhbH
MSMHEETPFPVTSWEDERLAAEEELPVSGAEFSFDESPQVTISRRDWSFDRRGEQDEARHNEKVKDSIKDNLDEVVSDGNIITGDPKSKKIIKVPMRSLELPRFKYGQGKDGVGSGDGSAQPGDKIGSQPGNKPGPGEEAGDQAGEEYYEAEITLEELQELVFQDLGLPRIKPKDAHDIETDVYDVKDVRKKRSPSNLDLGRTVMQNMLRNAQKTGKAEVKGISPDDFRVRTWEEETKPENNAVVIAMADISGSMGEFEKYLTRAFCWWTVNFLRSKYPKVEMEFIAHDTEAYEVNEEQFFTRGSSGGTKCSSANQRALELIDTKYPPSRYNVYPLHFSDGDNMYNDNDECVRLVKEMLDRDVNQYAFVKVGERNRSMGMWAMISSGLLSAYQKNITDERFKALTIPTKEDVLPALKTVFNPEEEAK